MIEALFATNMWVTIAALVSVFWLPQKDFWSLLILFYLVAFIGFTIVLAVELIPLTEVGIAFVTASTAWNLLVLLASLTMLKSQRQR